MAPRRDGREPWQVPASERRQENPKYRSPFGEDSGSVPPSGSWRELPEGLLPKISEVRE